MNYKMILFSMASFCLLISCSKKQSEDPFHSEEVTFTTSDGITIYGDLMVTDKEHPVILLFHQGGSNARAEYEPVIPKLAQEGYNVLAVDQRSGGQTYGSYNRTVYALSPYQDFPYCDTYPDFEAALAYISSNNFSGPVILWGSSYSGALAIQLAANHQDIVKGVLAFSPASGGPMAACKPDPYLESLNIPLLVLRPESEAQIESVQNQLKLVEAAGHQTYIANNGVHGSSMLVPSRIEGSAEEHWQKVLSFIEKAVE